MPSRASRAAILLAAISGAAMVVVSCSDSSTPATTTPKPVTMDGNWTGTTSDGRALSFSIAGTTVTNISVGFKLTGECSLAGLTVNVTGPAGHISGQQLTVGDPATALYVSGQIVGNTTASGSALTNYQGTQNGAACHSTGSSTWTASKQ